MTSQTTDNRLSLLIVDDESGIRALLHERLQKAGYKVDVAANGLHAMQKLKSGLKVDLLITDIKMPGMTGVELLTKIRADESLAHIPVIVMSAFAEKAVVTEILKKGIVDFATKPFSYNEFVEKVHKFFMKKNEDVKAA